MIKLYYPAFWQKKSLISYLLLPFGYIYLFLGYLRKLLVPPVKFPAYTICVGNATVGGTGKTQLVIKLAQELSKRNMNFIILSKGYSGKCHVPTLVTASSSPNIVGDEALELCRYGNSFVVPKIKDASQIIQKYKPDIILVDDGMQNPGFIKDIVIMTVDGTRGFGNGMPIPAGPMRSKYEDALDACDVVVVTGKPHGLDFGSKPVFDAEITSDRHFGEKGYYAFAGIGNPKKFFDLLKSRGAKVKTTLAFPDHHKYSDQDISGMMIEAHNKKLQLITTRKDYVKIKNYKKEVVPSIIPEFAGLGGLNREHIDVPIDYLEVELKMKKFKEFVELILSKTELS